VSPESSPVAFALALAAKDLGLITDVATEVGASMPQARLDAATIDAAIDSLPAGGDSDLAPWRSTCAGRRPATDHPEGVERGPRRAAAAAPASTGGGHQMADRILIKGAYVLSQDPDIGELAGGDVLIEGDRIAEVGKGLSAEGAQVIDATGDIVIPGFIDTHRHTWETSIRTCAPDYALITYFSAILDQFAPKYRPDDVLAANRWGALECINAGITTLVDWSHIMNTDEHAYGALQGLQETGIRSVFAFGFPNTVAGDVVVRPGLRRQRRAHRRGSRATAALGPPER
jgi:hypothetical protein